MEDQLYVLQIDAQEPRRSQLHGSCVPRTVQDSIQEQEPDIKPGTLENHHWDKLQTQKKKTQDPGK